MTEPPDHDHCHTLEEFERSGLQPLLRHIVRFFQGGCVTPVSRATDTLRPGGWVFFSFTAACLELLEQGDGRMRKAYEEAIKFGFRGVSRGGRNGIFLQRRSDRW